MSQAEKAQTPTERFRIQIAEPLTQRRLMFWVRSRRGIVFRLPLVAWPEIAAWVLRRTSGLQAGEHEC